MSGGSLDLAAVPLSVERYLNGSLLGRQVRVAVESRRDASGLENWASKNLRAERRAQPDQRPLRLVESNAAEELACFLDVERPDNALWLMRMTVAIEEAFASDAEKKATALLGLEAAYTALAQGATAPLTELDNLLHALCMGLSQGGIAQR